MPQWDANVYGSRLGDLYELPVAAVAFKDQYIAYLEVIAACHFELLAAGLSIVSKEVQGLGLPWPISTERREFVLTSTVVSVQLEFNRESQ